ncbi:hypothetical protein KAX75_13100 [candidate division WOR-3 bacterium]|nr:hypothetical protein [candidate division WOR-3 bacterium]
MTEEIRNYIVEAARRIIKSTWRGRDHTVEEMVDDLKSFLDEENEEIITEIEWQEILDRFSIVDLSKRVFQVKNVFIKMYGEKVSVEKDVQEKNAEIHITTLDPIEQEQELMQYIRETRKRCVKKIVSLYKKKIENSTHSPTNEELIDFIKKNSLGKKENRRTVLMALSHTIGAKKILKIFETIDNRKPFDDKRKLFDIWVLRQKGLKRK